jgi:hypothetical protein
VRCGGPLGDRELRRLLVGARLLDRLVPRLKPPRDCHGAHSSVPSAA